MRGNFIFLSAALRLNAAMLIAFHKPFGVLSQFTSDGSANRTLAEFGFSPRVYPIGRLDADSEGLLLLSDEPELNERLLHPRHAHEREYWAQVERIPAPAALAKLATGLVIQDRKTLPCRVWMLNPQPEIVGDDVKSLPLPGKESETPRVVSYDPPKLQPRDPPIRFRKNVSDCWIGLELVEGKNRQVRRMTAAIGHPTLRLVRVRVGDYRLNELPAGVWRELNQAARAAVLSIA